MIPLWSLPSDPANPSPIDHLDSLPDPLLLHILLNYISDIKSIGRCSAVSRRFRLLVPLVSSVLIRVDCIVYDDTPDPSSPGNLADEDDKPSLFFVSNHSPVQVLKNFTDLRSLRIDLPSGELSLNDSTSSSAASSSTLLRWRAHFGSSLDRCLILTATSSSAKTLNPSPASTGSESTTADYGMIPDSFYTNGGLKLRVDWTISSLIAASARHYLLQPIIAEHTKLESLVLTDADGQGVLRMDREQLDELRKKPLLASSASKRTMVPALSMRLWYAPVLELSCGVVLKGAALVAIRPSSEEKKDMGLGWIEEAFDGDGDEGDGMYAEVVRMLVKRRTYCLEMNSF